MSRVVDRARDRAIRAEELRRDTAAYARLPLDDHELAIADLAVDLDLDDQDIDDDAIYGEAG